MGRIALKRVGHDGGFLAPESLLVVESPDALLPSLSDSEGSLPHLSYDGPSRLLEVFAGSVRAEVLVPVGRPPTTMPQSGAPVVGGRTGHDDR